MEANGKQSKRWLKYLSTVIVALVMAFVICIAKDIFNVEEPEMILRILCDAFFIPGIVLFCFGLLTVCGKSGIRRLCQYVRQQHFPVEAV